MTATRDELAGEIAATRLVHLINGPGARSQSELIADAILARYAVVDRARFEAMQRACETARLYRNSPVRRERSSSPMEQLLFRKLDALAALAALEGQR